MRLTFRSVVKVPTPAPPACTERQPSWLASDESLAPAPEPFRGRGQLLIHALQFSRHKNSPAYHRADCFPTIRPTDLSAYLNRQPIYQVPSLERMACWEWA
jgi:hypothetical protein